MFGPSIFDEVVTLTSDNRVNVYLGTGERAFRAPVSYPTGPNPVALGCGMYRTGHDDLLVVQAGNNTLRYFVSDHSGALTAYHDYPTGGLIPQSILAVPNGVFVAHADRITYLPSTASYETQDPSVVLGSPALVNWDGNARDLCYLEFDGRSIEVIDRITGAIGMIYNGSDLAYISDDGQVVVSNGSVTMRIPFSEPIGGLSQAQNFLCVYLPASSRVMRLAFGDIPEMNGQRLYLTRRMPSGNDVVATLTYNYFALPAGSSMARIGNVDMSPYEDLIVNYPATQSLLY
jgi:hypothetical protein